MSGLWRGLAARERGLLIGLLVVLAGVPLVADRYLLSVLTLILYFAYVGQAWNIMMGFAGQLSLGHALYAGLGGYAAADNHMGALVVGLDVRRLYAITFGVGAACVGAAGAPMITIIPVTPFLSADYTLLGFVIVIVGGLGSMTGALLGGLLIGVSEAVAGLLLQPSLKSMFSFGLLIVVLLLRPQGLLGRKETP